MSKLKKTLFTLNLNPDEYKEITDMTYPLLKHYANKIGADFYEIKERKFPDWPPNYEKMQIYQLGREMKNDWNIFFDCDAMVCPDTPDVTNYIPKDTVAHNGKDMAGIRFKYDRFFWRDGRNIGSASWCCIASDWCLELFEPVPDMTPEDVQNSIFPITNELKNAVSPIRLVEDYVMARNIAKYGLKFTTLKEIFEDLKLGKFSFFYHLYAVPREEKVRKMQDIYKVWGF